MKKEHDYETLMYVVLVAGFLIRAFFSYTKSIYHDEAMYLALGFFAGLNPFYFLYTADYTAFWGGTIFSSLLPLVIDRISYSLISTGFGLRIAKVIAGVCSIYIVYKICKKTGNEKAGLIASFFLALNSTNVFSDFLKYEVYETLFVLLGAYFLIDKGKNSRYYSAICFFLSILMKYSAVVPVISILGVSFFADKKLRKKIIPTGFLLAVLCATFFMWHLNQVDVLGRTSEVYKSMKESPFDTVGTTITGFLFFFAVLLISFKKIKQDINLVWLVTGLFTILYFNITMPNYVFFTQYLTVAVPFMAMYTGVMLEKMDKKIVYGIIAVFFITNMLNMFNIIDFPIKSFLLFATPDWRPAVEHIRHYVDQGDKILATQHGAIWFYLDTNLGKVAENNNIFDLSSRILTSNKVEITSSAEQIAVEDILFDYKYVVYYSSDKPMPAWTLFLSDEVQTALQVYATNESKVYRMNWYDSYPYYVAVFKNGLVI